MKHLFTFSFYFFLFCGFSTILYAQEKHTDWGKLHGGIESNGALYKKDKTKPELDSTGFNTYLNLKYEYKKFSAGIQYEIYEPPMRGYDAELRGNKLMLYFANYANRNLSVTAGSFYDQFGSGLIFRSYEERALGINTSLRGLQVKYSPLEWINLKAIAGQPRRYLEYADAMTYGADGDFVVSRLWESNNAYTISLGASWIMRQNTKTIENSVDPKSVNLFSARTGFSNTHLNVGIEYTAKGKSQTFSETEGDYLAQSGDAFLINIDYTRPGFGVSSVFRRIEHMDYRVDGKRQSLYIPMNYIPALTKQHKYTLPGLYPYQANAEGEIGGQIDVFGDVPMGRYPLKVAVNTAWYRSLGKNARKTMPFFGKQGDNVFKEVSVEMEKRFHKNLKANIGGYWQEMYDSKHEKKKSLTFVGDVLWKLNRKLSLRGELQHMNTQMDDKAWIYGMLEVGVAPHWMIYVGGMRNYGAENPEHFYNIGASFAHKSLRVSAGYAKNRAGYQCAGGICRSVPGYTGAIASVSYVF